MKNVSVWQPRLKSLLTRVNPKTSYIARYTDMWNRQRESKIHDIHEIGSGTKLYYLWVKSYSTWGERERHNLSMLTAFISAPYHVRHPICKLLVSPRRALKINLPVWTQELNSLLFLKSPKSSAHFRWRTSFTPLVTFPIRGFILTSGNDASSPRTCLNTCAHVCT